jgi:predicted MFS family arabinose efflux permease
LRQAATRPRLWTAPFLALNLVMFLVFCNMAMFFLLFPELHRQGLGDKTAAMVVGAFSVSVLVLRPLISPWLQPGNARLWLGLGAVGVAAALATYPLAHSPTALVLLRVGHGLAYVLMASAALAAFTGCVPEGRSGEAFGVVGLVTLLPYAVLPPLVNRLSGVAGGYFSLLAWTASAMLLVLPLLVWLRPRAGTEEGEQSLRPGRAELAANLRNPAVLGLLALYLIETTFFAVQFYFVAPLFELRGAAGAGLFFTLATGSEIGVRLASGRLLDRWPKNRLLAGSSLLLSIGFAGLAVAGSTHVLLGLGLFMGLGWGVALPLFNAMMFDISAPRLRAFNANLGMEAFQGGFLLGPLAGGFALGGLSLGGIFWACAVGCLLTAPGALFFGVRRAAGNVTKSR